MALLEIPGWPLSYPFNLSTTNNTSYQSLTIDDTTEKVAWVLRCPKDGTLNRVGFKFGAVTQAPTNGLTVSFQGVGDDGNPDGTPDQTRLVSSGITANAWVTTGLITSDGTDTGTKRTVTKGELLAVVVEFASFSASDSLAISVNGLGNWNSTSEAVYRLHNTADTWGSRGTQVLNIGLQYDDEIWAPMTFCIASESAFTTAYSSASSPDVRGMKFTCPVGMRVVGVNMHCTLTSATTSTATVHLYDSNDVELASCSVDPDARLAVGAGGYCVPFDSIADSVILTAGATYRIVLEATGAGTIVLQGFTPDSTAFMTANPWGANAVGTTRKDTGAWTDAVDGVWFGIALLVDAIDTGAGGNVIVRRFYED